ncbi:FAD binding domain-containing protein [Colletotrichum orchidophilum]|uniref:FAD binding domain-containing protein n=1 Tax=Colletotrichum orchidophilum TaxID=1209926 RepID=A0A1G4BFE7_9PEZI|nr:FAD binding domain-containing protein [Colletotrichum orchidophilum]OHF00085.1 FAD binding domain-containing protein [Colletotrichum orchidophilum]
MQSPTSGPELLADEYPSPLRVAIVGAGIGGLAAAIGLRRSGHIVDLYEQSCFSTEIGAAVHLMPNGLSILRRWGLDTADFDANPMSRAVEHDQYGRIEKDIDLSRANLRWTDPWLLAQRAKFHKALKTKAVAAGATLHTSARVDGADPVNGAITLADGQAVAADVILGADGVYSVMRGLITDAKPFSSGKSAFRFMIPRKLALADPTTRPLAEVYDSLLAWAGRTRRIIMYSCSNNEMLNFVCMHPDEESQVNKTGGWNSRVTTEHILKVYDDFHPAVKSLLAKSDDSRILKGVWQLLDMEQIPWTKGRMALLGDAAHPFTPHQGQGAVQAIEDAASLSVVLPLGTHPEAVPERLRLYEEIRSRRAHSIQGYSREAGRDFGDDEKPEVNNTDELFSHDELDYSARMFRKWKHDKSPADFRLLPVGIGSFSGLRRDTSRKDASASRFKRAVVKFKTSKPFLEQLFPSEKFKFRRADTLCTASLVVTSLDNMSWLGGEGYVTLALQVHGVQYRKQDGGVVNGSFMPIHLVSRSEAVTSGREELGLPSVPCDLDMYQFDDSCRITASWGGAKFADISLSSLKAGNAAIERGPIGTVVDYGIIVYRYVPAVGRPGVADGEYACVIPHAGESKAEAVELVASSSSAKLDFKPLDWNQLPTMSHIASALSRMPVFDVVSAKISEGTNVSEYLSCRRID